MEGHYQTFLKSVLCASVTNRPEYSKRLTAITERECDSWEVRANDISAALMEIKRNDSTAINGVDTPEQLMLWARAQIEHFHAKIPFIMNEEAVK